jgi:hypothetical protein
MKIKTSKTVTLCKLEIEAAIGDWFDDKKFSGDYGNLSRRDYVSSIVWHTDRDFPTVTLDIREDTKDEPR